MLSWNRFSADLTFVNLFCIEDKNDETDIVLLYADDLFRKQGSTRAVTKW
ncbi:hypothetical protein ABIC45_000337 [Mucilaginibacter rubeus]|nr:hypothetical protein SAMN03159284_00378 [Mucilaginibacter sp. NFR10]